MSECCLKGFRWNATPQGQQSTLAGRDCYVTGSNSDTAIMVIHDLFGWRFGNTRILADHYAEEVGATVYVPDFFGGESVPTHILTENKWDQFDIPAFMSRNTRTIREPEIFECAKSLRSQHKYSRIGAIGFCFGGWAVFRLGAKGVQLVDCIVAAHPTFLEKKDIEQISVPVAILAPEIDSMFTEELKAYSNEVIPTLNVAYDYQYFPGLTHGFATRGNPNDEGEMEGMERAKNAAVLWFRQWLRNSAKIK